MKKSKHVIFFGDNFKEIVEDLIARGTIGAP